VELQLEMELLISKTTFIKPLAEFIFSLNHRLVLHLVNLRMKNEGRGYAFLGTLFLLPAFAEKTSSR
jgi:hypothetical protein